MPGGTPSVGLGVARVGIRNRYVPFQTQTRYTVSGVTRTSAGTALGGCTVSVFETVSNLFRASVVSDGSGNYAIDINGPGSGLTFFVVAYKAGAPDVSGTTVNTLVGT
jgi:hypothetical protein